MAHDHLIRAVARQAGVRVACTLSTGVVADGARRHGLTPAGTCAVGKALTSGLLLATMTKGGERVTVQVLGDGPIGSITVDATDEGDVRGYAGHPEAGATIDARGKVSRLVGKKGMVNVLRDLGLRELYQGQTALVSGEVDEDLEAYLTTSEQMPSALGCEVVLEGPRVVAAGGILVQGLPGSDPDSVRPVQALLRSGRLHELLSTGITDARELAAKMYPSEELEVIGDERHVRFQCRCSAERIGDMLKLLSTVDLDEMIADDRPAEITCNFCNTRYEIERRELEKIRAEIAGGPRQSN
jgi:molecular chaperone Hsp33